MTKSLQELITTFINGHLKEAQHRAKARTHRELREAYQSHTNSTFRTAVVAADFLKGDATFVEFCDVNFEEQNKA